MHAVIGHVHGDTVFTFSTDPGLKGEELIDVVDSTYLAFRRRLLSVSQGDDLRLSVVWSDAAIGSEMDRPRWRVQQLAHLRVGRIGRRDVIVAHRLLKNSLGFAGSDSRRILLTDACVRRLQIDPSDLRLESQAERYPHLGEVRTWVGDLSSRLDSPPGSPRDHPL